MSSKVKKAELADEASKLCDLIGHDWRYIRLTDTFRLCTVCDEIQIWWRKEWSRLKYEYMRKQLTTLFEERPDLFKDQWLF